MTFQILSRRDLLKAMGFLGLCSFSKYGKAASAPVWIDQRQVGSFVFRSTFSLSDAETVEVGLEDLEAELRRILSLQPSDQRIEVLLFESKEEYQKGLAARHPELSDRRALFIRQGQAATVYAYKQSALAVDLRHECTHALLHADTPNLPLWLDEGLAEYFEPPKHERANGVSHLDDLLADIKRNRQVSLKQLEQEKEFEAFIEKDYRSAWAWVHFLLHGPEEASKCLWKFLGILRQGKSSEPMSALLQHASPSYQAQFVAHFKNWSSIMAELNKDKTTG